MKHIFTLAATLFSVFMNVNAQHTLLADEVSFDEATGTITGYSGTATDIIVPEKIGGTKVTSIGEHAFRNKELTSVVIPGSVNTIQSHAFYNNKLTTVTIPDSVTTIEKYAFSFNKLEKVTIPNSVTIIGKNAFSVNKLITVTIPNGVTTINSNAFSNNKLRTVVIPESVTVIGLSAFKFNQLEEVSIPNSVTFIGDHAFSNNKLTTVTIPNGVTTIGQRTFQYNELTEITIPDNVTKIRVGAFFNNDLTHIDIPGGVTLIGKDAFAGNGLNEIILPKEKEGYTIEWRNEDDGIVEKVTNFSIGYSSTSFPKEYTITYDVNGGEHSNKADTYTIESEITLSDAAKDGYTFAGWYSKPDFTGEKIQVISSMTGDLTLYARFNSLTALPQKNLKTGIRLYPNPAVNEYFIVDNIEGKGQVSIYSLSGQLVLSQELIQVKQRINLPGLESGVYQVKVETSKGILTTKLVVK